MQRATAWQLGSASARGRGTHVLLRTQQKQGHPDRDSEPVNVNNSPYSMDSVAHGFRGTVQQSIGVLTSSTIPPALLGIEIGSVPMPISEGDFFTTTGFAFSSDSKFAFVSGSVNFSLICSFLIPLISGVVRKRKSIKAIRVFRCINHFECPISAIAWTS